MSRVPHKHVSQHPTLMVPLQMISLGNDGNMRGGGGGDLMLMFRVAVSEEMHCKGFID